MRVIVGAFGLLGLLISVAIIVSLSASHTQSVVNARKQVQPTLDHITGHSADGSDALQSAAIVARHTNGKFDGLMVNTVDIGGAYSTFFGLLPGDVIVAINGARVGDFELSDPDLARTQVFDAYRYSWPITVERAGTRMDLPLTGAATGRSGTPGSGASTPMAPLNNLLPKN